MICRRNESGVNGDDKAWKVGGCAIMEVVSGADEVWRREVELHDSAR